jgi:large subunit ribosomal protein L1
LATKQEILMLIKKARGSAERRNFVQSVEFIISLKGLDVKKDRDILNINEVVSLPHPFPQKPKICAVATGELALKLKQSGLADRVLSGDEIDTLATNKRASRKLAREYDYFVAEAGLMPKVGRALGPILGPRGKMPLPLPPGVAAVDAIVGRLRTSVRVRARGQLSFSCKIGSEDMTDEELADNAMAVLDALEKKLPQGRRNIKNLFVKLAMGSPATMVVVS